MPTIVKARHRTALDKKGAAITGEFEYVQWLTKIQPTGEWIFVSKYEEVEATTTQARGCVGPNCNSQTEQKGTTVVTKKGCGCGK